MVCVSNFLWCIALA